MPHRNNLLFAFSTLGWPDAGWAELAALAKSHGMAGIELRAQRGFDPARFLKRARIR